MTGAVAVKNISLSSVDKKEAVSFLGYKGGKEQPEDITADLLDKYEKLLLTAIRPRYAYGIFTADELKGLLTGNDINEHLKNCADVILMCVTLGLETDTLIRRISVGDITGTVITDALASAAAEQICEICEKDIKIVLSGKNLTTRYSAGYGDFPIESQGDFLRKLDAERKIGVYASENHLLIPRKSVTAVIGVY